MAGTGRATAHDLDELIRALEENPYQFGFYQALRLLECHHKDRPRLGRSKRPLDDPIRLAQLPSMTFESCSLAAFETGKNGKPHRLLARLFGLLGPNGPLPLYLTEHVQDRQRDFGDSAFAKFLDVFHHRMMSLFYRAWANSQPTVHYDRPESDRFSDFVGSLIGLGIPSLRKRDNIADQTKFYYSGRFSCQSHCAEGLREVLSDYFGLPFSIEEFVGEWMRLPSKHACRLGQANSMLGESLIIGSDVWGSQHKFRIALGPLGLKAYEGFLPTGDMFRRLVTLVRNYVGDELAWGVNLVLKRKEAPNLILDGSLRLGWTTWLGKRQGQEDLRDLNLDTDRHINLTIT